MIIVCNWRLVLLRAWSIRWIAASAVLTGLEAAFVVFGDQPPLGIPRGTFAGMALLTSMTAFAVRFFAQKGISNDP